MDAHAGGIDHDQFAIISGRNRCQQSVPNPGFTPANEPVVAGCRRPVALGNFSPRRARPEAPHDPVENPPVIHSRHATRLVGQQGLDDRPFPICQFIPPACHQTLQIRRLLNHANRRSSSHFMSLRPSTEKGPAAIAPRPPEPDIPVSAKKVRGECGVSVNLTFQEYDKQAKSKHYSSIVSQAKLGKLWGSRFRPNIGSFVLFIRFCLYSVGARWVECGIQYAGQGFKPSCDPATGEHG